MSLGGFSAINAEPLNRNLHYNYQLSLTDCVNSNSSKCGATNSKTNSNLTTNNYDNHSAVVKNYEEQVLSNEEGKRIY